MAKRRDRAKPPEHAAYRIKATLEGSAPPVWRELEVDGVLSFDDLNAVVQVAFDWDTPFDWRFEAGTRCFARPEVPREDGALHPNDHLLQTEIPRAGSGFRYAFEGDGRPAVTLEVIAIEPRSFPTAPRCLALEGFCLTSDGSRSAEHQAWLEALSDPAHPEHASAVEQADAAGDPDAFEQLRINRELHGNLGHDPWRLWAAMEAAGEDVARAIGSLVRCGETLPSGARAALLAAGPRAVPALHRVLEDLDLFEEDGPGGGWAPVHAVELLGELRATEAIPLLLELLPECGEDDLLTDVIVLALAAMGPAVLEPALQAVPAARDRDHLLALADALANAGAQDPRIHALLLDVLEREPMLGASFLASYGDPAAIAPLSERFDRLLQDEGRNEVDPINLADAIETLGGTLTADQEAEIDAIRRRNRAAPQTLAPEKKRGRNDPCHCGSGKKYKKCCYDSDRAA